MPLTDVGAVAGAVEAGVKLAIEILHKDQHELITEAKVKAEQDCERFKRHLLNGSFDSVNLMLDGLQHGIRVNVTADEMGQLTQSRLLYSRYQLLGYYCRARAADFAWDVVAIMATADKPKAT